MRLAARLQTVIDILEAVQNSGRGADLVIQQELRQRRFMGGGDRRFVKGRVYDMFHAWGVLSARLAATSPPSMRLMAAVHESLQGELTVADIFTGEAHAPAPLTPDEQRSLEQALAVSEVSDAAHYNMPDWVWDELVQAYGPKARDVATALNTSAPLDIRLMSGVDRTAFMAACEGKGFEVAAIPETQTGVRFLKNVPIGEVPGYRDKQFIVQDAGSQVVANLTALQPDKTGWDVCAGGGGKTIALLDRLGADGRLLATDVAHDRLKEISKRIGAVLAQRLNIRSLRPDWLDQDQTMPDGAQDIHWAMIDAPCSGTGSWRRTPHERWRFTKDRFSHLQAVQAQLLDRVGAQIPKGGTLTYITCSVLPQENQDQIAAFLARTSRFSVLPLDQIWSDMVSTTLTSSVNAGMLQLRPDVHQTDGFFMAVMQAT